MNADDYYKCRKHRKLNKKFSEFSVREIYLCLKLAEYLLLSLLFL